MQASKQEPSATIGRSGTADTGMFSESGLMSAVPRPTSRAMFLSTMDNLRGALEGVAPDSAASADQLLGTLLTKVATTERALLNARATHGFARIDPMLGEVFDPHHHQAIFEVSARPQPAGPSHRPCNRSMRITTVAVPGTWTAWSRQETAERRSDGDQDAAAINPWRTASRRQRARCFERPCDDVGSRRGRCSRRPRRIR
jgi:GrpE